MPEIILYLTKKDATSIVEWLNQDSDIAWIVKDSQQGNKFHWKAVQSIQTFEEATYCLWRVGAGHLRIPSGSHKIQDTVVLNPFIGWEQEIKSGAANTPWFGAAAPETFHFRFAEAGRESPDSLGRSGFNWIGNYFSVIGTSAPKECEQWWSRLKRFIKKNSTGIPWPNIHGEGKVGSYAFPEAYTQLQKGRSFDINP